MQTKLLLALMLAFMVAITSSAQIDVEGKVKDKSRDRADQRTDEGIDKSLDKLEEGIGSIFKKKKNTKNKEEEEEEEESDNEGEESEDESSEIESAKTPQQQKQKLEANTQYDFVPGDKILYFEDFSQDAVGDFPALWTTNGSAEVKTVNLAPGNWFHMNGQDAVYCYTKPIAFPSNFIMEFDIIPDAQFEHGFQLTFYQEPEEKELTDDLYPGVKGLHISMAADGWQTLGYDNITNGDWLDGQSTTNPVVKEEPNHVIIWIQNRRVRIYHQGRKALDMPTNIYTGTKFNRFRFSGWDRYAYPFVSNLKITTASPDTRSKLITEGKLVSYGIYFDSGKDVVKPESYGAIKEIATVLKENPSVRVKIVGHTDSDGDDAKNLDLSKRRAASVKNYLASQFQVNGGNIETDGKGESAPMESNNTSEGKAKNRRVEFLKL